MPVTVGLVKGEMQDHRGEDEQREREREPDAQRSIRDAEHAPRAPFQGRAHPRVQRRDLAVAGAPLAQASLLELIDGSEQRHPVLGLDPLVSPGAWINSSVASVTTPIGARCP